MESIAEPIRAGLTPEERAELERWLDSPEGRRTIFETLLDIERIIIEMKKAREIPHHLLHLPMDI